ncbi:ABC transporter permease [Prolixibacteraceae bacterium JC049]|nr:ABC transporter permease [Prolixibacteraceae bacterium JC049]
MSFYRHFLQFLRVIQRRKVTTLIAIGGFALSLSVVVLLTVFIASEKSMNMTYPNVSNIYRVKSNNNGVNLPTLLADGFSNDVPGIKANTIFRHNYDKVKVNDDFINSLFAIVDNEYLNIFSHRLIYSDAEHNLDVKNNIILTQSYAKKLYGDVNPVGNYMEMRDQQLKVVGVMTDPPVNSSFQFDGLIGEVTSTQYTQRTYNKTTYYLMNHFLQLNEGANPKEVELKLAGMLKDKEGYDNTILEIQPLKEIYFDVKAHSSLPVANSSMLKLLIWISLVILLMGVFNYVSLAVSVNSERKSEIAMRKINGAGAKFIFKQFLGESVFVCVVILLLATMIAVVIAPSFSNILGKNIDLWLLMRSGVSWGLLTVLFIAIVLLAGVVPALIAARAIPVIALKGKGSKKNNLFRQSVLVFQLTASIALLFCVATIWKQIEFAKTQDVGFDRDLLVQINLSYFEKDPSALKDKLLQISNVKNASFTAGSPYYICSSMSGKVEEVDLSDVSSIEVDNDFASTFDVEIIAGRDFRLTDKNSCLINDKLYRKMGWDNLDGKEMFGGRVVGVFKDFHFKDIHHDVGYLKLNKIDELEWVTAMNVRLLGNDFSNTLSQMKNLVHEIDPDLDFRYQFYDDIIAKLYRKEEKQAYAVGLFAIIAILIACLGLIGVAEYTITQRVKEIGIRKVNGATVAEILSMINGGFGKWVLLSFAIAAPIGFYTMSKWLQNFAFKTALSWWVYALAGIVVLTVALITIMFQSYKAATCNPVETLRYE